MLFCFQQERRDGKEVHAKVFASLRKRIVQRNGDLRGSGNEDDMMKIWTHAVVVLLIAARLATVDMMPRKVVADHGAIAERGTHSELLAQNGIYARMVRDQYRDFDEMKKRLGGDK